MTGWRTVREEWVTRKDATTSAFVQGVIYARLHFIVWEGHLFCDMFLLSLRYICIIMHHKCWFVSFFIALRNKSALLSIAFLYRIDNLWSWFSSGRALRLCLAHRRRLLVVSIHTSIPWRRLGFGAPPIYRFTFSPNCVLLNFAISVVSTPNCKPKGLGLNLGQGVRRSVHPALYFA